jgi:CheY-like chemotaxis protein
MASTPILLVEDDPDIRELFAETLRQAGVQVATAENGFEALRLLRESSFVPSGILLDLMMPVMDGYAFLFERRKDPILASIPVAVVTAAPRVNLAQVGPGVEIVPKPIDAPRLLSVVNGLRERSPVRD